MSIPQFTEIKNEGHVLAYQGDDVFSKGFHTFTTLAVDLEPGSVIKSDGTALVAAATTGDVKVSLDYAKAGSNVRIRTVGVLAVIKEGSLITASGGLDNAKNLLTASGFVRIQ
ncbi:MULTISPECIES: hypothetical protein [Yersinia]|uniref:hypothetical protein n=1 Tax=Yersinia TaxID=629 RepID=UPI000BFCF602|nr:MULTISPECIES: hypothetical protein [Yersinia]ATM85938.1 hypothetical protein CRN74_07510 [Yersinia frederiksenii]MCB5316432.1 hypothetical protein [Yersinia massiliensis]